MALQSSGPMTWSTLNVAFGNSSNTQLALSTIRASTQGVGTSNISLSNWQNACIPYNGVCMNRYLANMTTAITDAASANTALNNSNGTISYVTSITIPNADNFGNEWTGFLKVAADGVQTFQIGTDDGGEFWFNNSIVATHYGSHEAIPPGNAGTTSNIPGGVYSFKFRQQEGGGGQNAFVAYTPPGGTAAQPSSTTNADFMTRAVYLYKPIIKLDANDLFYRQNVSLNSQISTWSNNGTDGTLRHAIGASGNSTTLPTLGSNANGLFVNFTRANQQHFAFGNLEFNQFQSTDAAPIAIKGITFFFVSSMSQTDTATFERILDFGLGQGNGNILVSRYNLTSRINITILNGATGLIQRHWNNTVDGGVHVYSIVVTNGNPITATLHVDNQAITTGINNDFTATGPMTNRTTTLNYIGRSNWPADPYFTGTIRELLVFREVIDTQTLSRMNNYLMYKWGIQASMPPVTSGLVGLYTGESWTGTQWTDLSGSGNHATTLRGSITTTTLNSLTALTGATTAGIRFPSAILPTTYTLFHVARYINTTNRGRIFDGVTNNWLSGFHTAKAGVAYHGDTGGWVTGTTDLHGTNWVISSDQNNLYRSQGVNRTVANYANGANASLAINHGSYVSVEPSDWAVAAVIVFNRTLTTNEIVQVETFLNRRYVVF